MFVVFPAAADRPGGDGRGPRRHSASPSLHRPLLAAHGRAPPQLAVPTSTRHPAPALIFLTQREASAVRGESPAALPVPGRISSVQLLLCVQRGRLWSRIRRSVARSRDADGRGVQRQRLPATLRASAGLQLCGRAAATMRHAPHDRSSEIQGLKTCSKAFIPHASSYACT